MEDGRERRHPECARSRHLTEDIHLNRAHLPECHLHLSLRVIHTGILAREETLDMPVGIGYRHTIEVDRADLRNHDASLRRDSLAQMILRCAPEIYYHLIAGSKTVILWSGEIFTRLECKRARVEHLVAIYLAGRHSVIVTLVDLTSDFIQRLVRNIVGCIVNSFDSGCSGFLIGDIAFGCRLLAKACLDTVGLLWGYTLRHKFGAYLLVGFPGCRCLLDVGDYFIVGQGRGKEAHSHKERQENASHIHIWVSVFPGESLLSSELLFLSIHDYMIDNQSYITTHPPGGPGRAANYLQS